MPGERSGDIVNLAQPRRLSACRIASPKGQDTVVYSDRPDDTQASGLHANGILWRIATSRLGYEYQACMKLQIPHHTTLVRLGASLEAKGSFQVQYHASLACVYSSVRCRHVCVAILQKWDEVAIAVSLRHYSTGFRAFRDAANPEN